MESYYHPYVLLDQYVVFQYIPVHSNYCFKLASVDDTSKEQDSVSLPCNHYYNKSFKNARGIRFIGHGF